MADGSIVINTEIDSSGIAQGLQDVNNRLKKCGEGMKSIGDSMTQYVTLPLAALGGMALKSASDMDGASKKIQSSLGVTGDEAKKLGEAAQEVWKKGFGESLDEVSTSLIQVKQNMKDIPNESVEGATKSALALSKAFGTDVNEVTRGASQMMKQFGLSSEEAFDMLTKGAQNGLNFSNELFDNVSEYAPLFKQAGFSADEMFTILSNGTKDGAYNLDYVNDLVKEFGIRAQDGSKGVAEGFGELSKETQGVWAAMNEGKATTADVFNAVLKDLGGMDDKVKANQIGVALFGR